MRVYICFACCEARHGECDGAPCKCDCEIATLGTDAESMNHVRAIKILRAVYNYLNTIRGMAFVGVKHPSEVQATIGSFLDEYGPHQSEDFKKRIVEFKDTRNPWMKQ